MDTTQHEASSQQGDWEPQKRPQQTSHGEEEEEEKEEEINPFDESISDLAFEIQSFAESDEDVFHDDATASETDSCASYDDDDDDDSQEDSLASSDEESCCSIYDDDQDLACLLASYQNLAPGERKVRFSTVEIREYASVLGDHPCVQDSCPITLDWRHARGYKRDVNSFENSRFFLRRGYPQKLTPSERRRRIRETSRLSKRALREMELQVAMHRLEDSMTGMSDFWQQIDRQEASSSSDPEGFWSSSADAMGDSKIQAS